MEEVCRKNVIVIISMLQIAWDETNKIYKVEHKGWPDSEATRELEDAKQKMIEAVEVLKSAINKLHID